MRKNDIIEIEIKGINNKGKAFGYYEDLKAFININAGVNQKIRGRICKIKTNQGKISLCNVEIIDYANRNNSLYDVLEKQVGGASYQYCTYSEQLEEKSRHLKKLLDECVKNEYEYFDPIESVSKIKYRNKMEFSFGNETKDGPILLGLHKQNSFHDIVDVSHLKFMDDNFNSIYMLSNEYFKSIEKDYGISFYHRLDHEGYFRNLVIRKGENTKQISINLLTTSQIEKSLEDSILKEYVDKLLKLKLDNEFKISSIIHTTNDDLSDMVKKGEENILYGTRDISEKLFDLEFKISPYSFFQTNSSTVEVLYQKVLDNLDIILEKGEKPIIFDLFSGTGTISQIVSRKAKEVYGIEIVEEAVEKAKENAKLNGLENVHFIAGDVFEKLDELNNLSIKPDVLILDPPRMGVLTKTIEKLVKYEVEYILYISCNPFTLASDIRDFQEYGYIVKNAQMVDMFPYTNHMETIVLLSKIKDRENMNEKEFNSLMANGFSQAIQGDSYDIDEVFEKLEKGL